MTIGTVGVLNVGAGDTKLTFDNNNPMETARSARIVADMLHRGYVLFIDTGNRNYQRVLQFDEKVCEYIIADLAEQPRSAPKPHLETAADEPSRETSSSEGDEARAEATADAPKPKPGRKRVAAAATSGIAVARSAGG